MTRLAINPLSPVPFTPPGRTTRRPQRFLPTAAPTQRGAVIGPSFELVFGFIPAVNIGNFFGVENDVARTLLNIFADPITIGTTFLTGGLTAAGKVASATRALETTKGVLRLQKGVTGLERVNSTREALKILAKAETNPEAVKALQLAIGAKDAMGFTKAARALVKTPVTSNIRKELPTVEELFKLDDLLQAEKLFDAGQAGTGLTKTLVPGFVNQVEQGQRALIQGRVPFTNIRKSIVEGRPIYNFLDSIFPASPLIGDRLKKVAQGTGILGTGGSILASTTRDMFRGMHINRGIFMEKEVVPEARKIIAGLKQKIERIAPGSSTQGLPEILTFFREGRGIDKATVEALGLGDEFVRLGIKSRTGKKASGETFEFFDKLELEKFLDRRGNWRKAADELNRDLERHFEDLRQFMNDSGLGIDIPHLESYINRIWDVGTKTAGKIAREWQRDGTFFNKRKFATAIQGMTKGFKLKTTNAFDLLNEYQLASARIVQNKQIIETIKDPLNKLIFNNIRVPLLASRKTLERLNKSDPKLDLFKEYVEITDKKLLSFLGVSKVTNARNMVPRSVARDLGAIFGKPFDGPIAKFADKFNASAKFLQLVSSFFHGVTLIESSVAVLGPIKGLRVAISLGGGIPFLPKRMRDAMMKTGLGKDATALTDDAISGARAAGLKVELKSAGEASTFSPDIQMTVVRDMITGVENAIKSRIPGSAKIVDTIGPGKYSDMFNTALWDNFHTPVKLISYQDNLKKMIKLNPNADPSQLAADVASFVNDAFGGQNWERLFVHPKFKQVMHWALLAPDWTISNLRIAGIGTTGLKGAVRGVIGKGRNPKEQLVGSYWRTALPVYYATINLLNRANSGHWIWENPPGERLAIQLSEKDDKGRLQFIKLGKQFREPLRWLTEPDKIFGSKLSPGIQIVVEQFTAHSTTGFPTEFAAEKQPVPLTIMEQVPLRAKNFISKFIPFSFQGNSFMMALPKSTFNEKDAIRGVADAMKGGKFRKGADVKAIRAILQLAQANGLNVSRIKSAVKRGVGDPSGILDKE